MSWQTRKPYYRPRVTAFDAAEGTVRLFLDRWEYQDIGNATPTDADYSYFNGEGWVSYRPNDTVDGPSYLEVETEEAVILYESLGATLRSLGALPEEVPA